MPTALKVVMFTDQVKSTLHTARRTSAEIAQVNRAQTDDRLQFELHIGIDFGEVLVLQNGDLRGNAANRAARVCAECPPAEVYFTE